MNTPQQNEELLQDLQPAVGSTPFLYLAEENGVWGVVTRRDDAEGVFAASGGVLGVDPVAASGYRIARMPAALMVYTPS